MEQRAYGPAPRTGGTGMKSALRVLAAAGSLSLAFFATDGAFAQKGGGILHIGHFDSPASMSMLEESTQAVKWHDGKPFTAADVKCTFELMMDNAKEKLRLNPRKSWYTNVAEVGTNGDYEATVHLKLPQPSFLALLATGWSPIYP